MAGFRYCLGRWKMVREPCQLTSCLFLQNLIQLEISDQHDVVSRDLSSEAGPPTSVPQGSSGGRDMTSELREVITRLGSAASSATSSLALSISSSFGLTPQGAARSFHDSSIPSNTGRSTVRAALPAQEVEQCQPVPRTAELPAVKISQHGGEEVRCLFRFFIAPTHPAGGGQAVLPIQQVP